MAKPQAGPKDWDKQLPEEYFDELEQFIVDAGDTQGALIEILHKAQSIFGYLPRDVQLFIARN